MLVHIPNPSAICPGSLRFLRERFRIALAFNVAGGDIRRSQGEASLPVQYAFMEGVGVDFDSPPDEENYIQNKQAWESPMGLELLMTAWPLDELPEVLIAKISNVN